MPKPPIDPDSFDKVNYVIDAWTTGCDAPWYIYVETLKPALLAAFITLITFGWDDVARGFFRPRSSQNRRTKKRKGKWNRRIPRFPELGEAIGGRLPGSKEVKGVRWSSFGNTMWRVDEVMQHALFWWLVADVAEEFAFEWTSLLYESYWCQPDPPGGFSYHTVGGSPIRSGRWWVAGFPFEDWENSPPAWNLNTGGTGAVTATVTAAVKVVQRNPYPDPGSVRVGVRIIGSGEVAFASGFNDVVIDGEIDALVTGALPPGTNFEVVVWMEGTPWASYGAGVVVGQEVKE
ncbi:hypothetical protein LCGC14_1989650 [marine sediment metagenome]|uniref:Uncharacterized protein n=1 Tax=marine sediment metagenome TaxID=412755 RepID=A0A0F9F6P2_9ZZZZ